MKNHWISRVTYFIYVTGITAIAWTVPAGQAQADDAKDPSVTPPPAWMLPAEPNPDAEAATEADMKPYTTKIRGSNTTFEMVPIPGGTFLMGSPEDEDGRNDDEGPQVQVRVDPFWMGKYEVTWDEYELWAMGLDRQRRQLLRQTATDRDKLADTITMPTKPYADMSFGMGKDRCPAICMTQLAAKMYCKWLSAKTGHYYRLPTEAEWEYACRAGTTTAYSFGDDPDDLEDYAWFFDNGDDRYHEVGGKKPNPWGLYDMHGNVAEWVLDQYSAEGYTVPDSPPAVNPLVLPKSIYPRVVRGGSWDDDPEQLRSAARRASDKSWKAQDPQLPQSIWYHTDAPFVGFRIVRPLKVPTAAEAAKYDIDPVQKQDMLDYAQAHAGGY